MAKVRRRSDESRLVAVQARVRALAREHDGFADAIRAAYGDYLALVDVHHRESQDLDRRERRLALAVLEQGRLRDPLTEGEANTPCTFVRFWGLCPMALADALEGRTPSAWTSAELDRASAEAGLAALRVNLDREANASDSAGSWTPEDRAAVQAGTHKVYRWEVMVAKPNDWQPPVHPDSMELEDLRGYPIAKYHTIVMHTLGALADAGSSRPIVPLPEKAGDPFQHVIARLRWHRRSPTESGRNDSPEPQLLSAMLPPALAEQMLAYAEDWIASQLPTRSGRGSNAPAASDASPPPLKAGRAPTQKAKQINARRLAEVISDKKKTGEVIALLKDNRSYREVAEKTGVSKSSVARVAKDFHLTGHGPARVPDAEGQVDGMSVKRSRRKSPEK
jgi:hypothetical protein